MSSSQLERDRRKRNESSSCWAFHDSQTRVLPSPKCNSDFSSSAPSFIYFLCMFCSSRRTSPLFILRDRVPGRNDLVMRSNRGFWRKCAPSKSSQKSSPVEHASVQSGRAHQVTEESSPLYILHFFRSLRPCCMCCCYFQVLHQPQASLHNTYSQLE